MINPALQALAKAQSKKGFWELADWMELVDQTDFAKLAADIEALEAELERKAWIIEQVKEQARGWAQEARTQKSTVHEIYQLVTDATGEPGNWHGAKPVAALKAENARLQEAVLKAYDATSYAAAPINSQATMYYASQSQEAHDILGEVYDPAWRAQAALKEDHNE